MRFLTEKNDFGLLNDDLFEKFFDYPYSKMGKNLQRMKTDILETKDEYNILIDIPGYDKNDIKIHVGENYLTVYVKQEDVEELKEGCKYVYRERFKGTLSRSFYIGNIQENDIKAKYKNGTLELKFPKKSTEENKKTWIRID